MAKRSLSHALRQLFAGDSARSAQPVTPPPPRPPEEPPARPIDVEDRQFLHFARQVRLGDAAAMWEFAGYFRLHFNGSGRECIERYEDDPSEETQKALEIYVCHHPDDAFPLKAYMLWIHRAAQCGYGAAIGLLERCPYYREGAYLPEGLFNPDRDNYMHFWSSDSLRKLGFPQVPPGRTDCCLRWKSAFGLLFLEYTKDYIPADESGFGREDDIGCMLYDSFFNHITGKNWEEIRRCRDEFAKKREDYRRDKRL